MRCSPEVYYQMSSSQKHYWVCPFKIRCLLAHCSIYNPDDALERLVFHYIFIPWLQHELDLFTERFNNTKPRYNMHKILPHGRPNDVFYHPEKPDSRYFSITSAAQFHQPVTDELCSI
ncbi:hypothetical protein K503DRAFT_369762 [Rhizopogon vinicolor AM-OR11-026]|uniref:Uncharacterized protein n=1 Tax=Rhizopogon vinicolor AM-OR11-026 TaxID=1314800 RepID=A0A1B7MS43_9AGAM|nr:hypothetical protein K503DRAFT_369762 [Rhizopogon vinicolor AM-OR11-026]